MLGAIVKSVGGKLVTNNPKVAKDKLMGRKKVPLPVKKLQRIW